MSVTELSRNRVRVRLASLEETYTSFPVNQTTLSVSTAVYERARERCEAGLVDVYVAVYNDAEDVLLVRGGGGSDGAADGYGDGTWELPHTEPATEDRLEERARSAVRDAAGVTCSITDVDRVTILGVLDEADPERDPVYRLVTVFAGHHVDGSPDEGVEWRSEVPEPVLSAD